ncbi:MAG: TadE/TadG family type IV pilus assembly protein [Mesorhizobium sp.]
MLVEFTIILVPFVLLTFGTIEYGRLAWIREEMSEVAIMAARCMGVLHPACAENGQYSEEKTIDFITEMARTRSVSLIPSDVALDSATSCAGLAGFSEVRIDFSFVSAVPVVMTLLSGGLPLSAKACFPNQEAGN